MNKNRVIQLAQSSHWSDARDLCMKLCEAEPGDSENWFLLGTIYGQMGEYTHAESCCRKALELNPVNPDLHRNLGNLLLRQGRHEDASTSLEEAIKLKPGFTEALFDLGNTRHAQGRHREAVEIYQSIISTHPGHPDTRINLAMSLRCLKDHAGTAVACRDVLALQPDRVDAHLLLAESLSSLDSHEEAMKHCQRASDLRPDDESIRVKLGLKQQFLGHYDAAFTSYERAIAINPEMAEARILRAMLLLQRGDFDRGWSEYQWRWKWKKRHPRAFSQPLWDGSKLNGRTILLHPEQGYGDTIQFIRFAPLVKTRGGRVIVEVHAPLVRLLERCEGIDRIIVAGQALPPFDVHAPLMSLPGLLGTRPETIPSKFPYVQTSGTIKPPLGEKLHQHSDRFRVGIVWAGGARAKNDQQRSCPPHYFQQLYEIPGTAFFSLQKDADGQEPEGPGRTTRVIDLGSDLGDFLDTATSISSLDLVISVDTAVAHLAGAMARPVWILLPFSPDWRWMLDRDDSPWYPTARLFRQRRIGDWAELLDRVAKALTGQVASRNKHNNGNTASQ